MKKILHYLLAITALMGLANVAKAADTGTTPYVGSTHTYTVARGDASSTLNWQIIAGTAEGYILSNETTETVTIVWKKPGNYTLQLTETINGCSTTKTLTIQTSNVFDVDVIAKGNETAICNTEDGNVIPDDDNHSTTSTATYVITRNSGVATWTPEWEVVFTATTTGTLGTVTVGTGSGTLTDEGSNSYKLTGIPASKASVEISVPVTGIVYNEFTSQLNITSAKEFDYNNTDSDSGNNEADITIKKIPNTGEIQAN